LSSRTEANQGKRKKSHKDDVDTPETLKAPLER